MPPRKRAGPATRQPPTPAAAAPHPAEQPVEERDEGQQPGGTYRIKAPNTYGAGVWPNKDFSKVGPRPLQDELWMWQAIAADIQQQRLNNKWTQQQLARKAGLSLNTVTALERGELTTLDTLLRVAVFLGLDIRNTVPVRFSRPPS